MASGRPNRTSVTRTALGADGLPTDSMAIRVACALFGCYPARLLLDGTLAGLRLCPVALPFSGAPRGADTLESNCPAGIIAPHGRIYPTRIGHPRWMTKRLIPGESLDAA